MYLDTLTNRYFEFRYLIFMSILCIDCIEERMFSFHSIRRFCGGILHTIFLENVVLLCLLTRVRELSISLFFFLQKRFLSSQFCWDWFLSVVFLSLKNKVKGDDYWCKRSGVLKYHPYRLWSIRNVQQ